MDCPVERQAMYNPYRRLGSTPWHLQRESGSSRVNHRVMAYLIQVSGREVSFPCTKCARGQGMWDCCVVHPNIEVGAESGRLACANCSVNGKFSGYVFEEDPWMDSESHQSSDSQEETATGPRTSLSPVPPSTFPLPSHVATAPIEQEDNVAVPNDDGFVDMAMEDTAALSTLSLAKSMSPSPEGMEMDCPSLGPLSEVEDAALEAEIPEAGPAAVRPPVSIAVGATKSQFLRDMEARIAARREAREATREGPKSVILAGSDIATECTQPLDRQDMFGREINHFGHAFETRPSPEGVPLPIGRRAGGKRKPDGEATLKKRTRFPPKPNITVARGRSGSQSS